MMPNAQDIEVAVSSDNFFLARQPILGRNQRLVAYELLFRHAADDADANVTNQAAATAAVISHASQLGLEQVVGERQAYVNVDEVVLMSDFVRFLPHYKVVLEILETVKATPEIIARVNELKSYGFKFAIDDVAVDTPDVRIFADLVDIIKIDVQAVSPDKLAALTNTFRRSDKKLLAEKVETVEEFNTCLALGFEFFQGFYFARPVILSGKKIAPSELVILNLLSLINSDADNREVELAVKRDALISLNLLRLVNTPAARVRNHIDSIGQALQVLGRDQFQRWLQILLYATPGKTVEFNSPLLQMASTRGKFMELMMLRMQPRQRAAAESAFSVGIMSLMDALLSMSMHDILSTVSLPHEVRSALLDRSGLLGQMLRTVELLEGAQGGPELGKALKALGISVQDVREIEAEAFGWVNELVA